MKSKLLTFIFLLILSSSCTSKKAILSQYEQYEFHHEKGEYQQALPYAIKSLDLFKKKKGVKHEKYSTLLNNLGDLYRLLGQYDEALPLLEEALFQTEKFYGKMHASYAYRLSTIGALYFEQGEYELAMHSYNEALHITEKTLGKMHKQYAGILNRLGLLHTKIGDFSTAIDLYEEALIITENTLGKEHPSYGIRLNNLAALYKDLGNYQEAITLYKEALLVIEETQGKEHSDYALCLNNFGTLYHRIGEFERAVPLYEESLILTEKTLGKKHPYYGMRLNNLASLFKDLGNFEKALKNFEVALIITEETLGKDHPSYGNTLNNIALLHRDLGNYKEALSLFQEALIVTENTLGKEHPDYSLRLNNLAVLYTDMGEYNQALEISKQAVQITKETLGKEHPDYGNRLNNLALLYRELANYDIALKLFEEAIQNTEQSLGKDDPSYGIMLSNLAMLYRDMGNSDKALFTYNESKNHLLKNLGKMLAFLPEDEMGKYVKGLEFRLEEFHSFYFQHYPINEKAAAEAFEIELATKGLRLNSSIQMRQSIVSSNDTTALAIFDQWTMTKYQLANQYHNTNSDPRIVEELKGKANTFEGQLLKLSKTFQQAASVGNNSWKNIQQVLEPNELAIEFAAFDYHNGKEWTDSTIYTALLLSKEAEHPLMIQLFEEEQLNSLLTNDSNENSSSISGLYRGAQLLDNTMGVNGEKLYNLIWKPIEKYANPGDHIYFSPSGLLHQIAFAAIPINKNECLSDKYQFCQLSTTAKLLNQEEQIHNLPESIALFGGIQYDASEDELVVNAGEKKTEEQTMPSYIEGMNRGENWNYLPGTLKEVMAIDSIAHANQISTQVYTGLQATEESYRALSGTNSPDVLHIATHGFFFPDPEEIKPNDLSEIDNQAYRLSDNPLNRAGLILSGGNRAWQGQDPPTGVADGILTAYEATNVSLTNTKLVVLSACETGLGEIQGSEGVFGLQRAFKAAGAEYLIMSLWKVPDAETAEFMENFYRNWLEGISIEEAFRKTQQYMKMKYSNDPYKWAAFILVR